MGQQSPRRIPKPRVARSSRARGTFPQVADSAI